MKAAPSRVHRRWGKLPWAPDAEGGAMPVVEVMRWPSV